MSEKYITTDLNGIKELFPELQSPKNWWPIIPKPQARYIVLQENEKSLCFAGIVYKNNTDAEVQGLYATKKYRNPTAVFKLMDHVGYILMEYNVKIYVINDAALWGWQRIGFRITKQKKMKYWTAYWVERKAIWQKQADQKLK